MFIKSISYKESVQLTLHTNDITTNNSTFFYRSTSKFLNTKYSIFLLVTHFFKLQKVIPWQIQNKYFNLIRNKLLQRYAIIKSRYYNSNNITKNRKMRTYFNFSYKKYRFHFGIFILCNHMTSKDDTKTTCTHPSLVVYSNYWRLHKKYIPSTTLEVPSTSNSITPSQC